MEGHRELHHLSTATGTVSHLISAMTQALTGPEFIGEGGEAQRGQAACPNAHN